MSDTVEQERRTERLNDVRHVMSTVQGRRFVWGVIADAGVFRSSFTNHSGRMSFNEGMRNMGLKVLDDVTEACPEQFALAQREYREKETVDAERRNRTT